MTVRFIFHKYRLLIFFLNLFEVSLELRIRLYIAVSVEVRKRVGQKFSPWNGLFKYFEIMYVVADERDVVYLRSNLRKDDVFLYRINTTAHKVQKMLLSMLSRVNELYEKPEFYNTITNTCTTNIARHVNLVTKGRIPWSWKIFVPVFSDRLAYKVGLIENSLPFTDIRRRARINERAHEVGDRPEFSKAIRGI
jgi:Domain of unknown function (DUF4105)